MVFDLSFSIGIPRIDGSPFDSAKGLAQGEFAERIQLKLNINEARRFWAYPVLETLIKCGY